VTSEAPIRAAVTQDGKATVNDRDRVILNTVDRFRADGAALKEWWEQADAHNSYAQRFELARSFNRPESAYGFFDRVSLGGVMMPVMGSVQDMDYDQPRVPPGMEKPSAEWLRDQLREFVLHYFMRVSSFRQPEAVVDTQPPAPPPYLERLTWCPTPDVIRQGFGFSQHYYKLRATGRVGKFSSAEEFAIVDLREIGPKYEWIVLKVRIFDFTVKSRPLGPDGPELVFGLSEESYLVLSRDFVLNEDNPSPDLLGRYGLGYAFIRNPTQGLIRYGPGEFDAAVELIQFRVLENGKIKVRMVFVVNRPERIANITLDPLEWTFRFADLMSFGTASRFLDPFKGALRTLPLNFGGFDPVYTLIGLANIFTAGWATEKLCISREQLDKVFLLQHFMQHYVTVVGSLLTWRQIPNWLDAAALPDWVVAGRSS
jgi:hypothetical protein